MPWYFARPFFVDRFRWRHPVNNCDNEIINIHQNLAEMMFDLIAKLSLLGV